MRYYGNVILHLQQYSHRLNLSFFNVTAKKPAEIQSNNVVRSYVYPFTCNNSCTTERIFIKL